MGCGNPNDNPKNKHMKHSPITNKDNLESINSKELYISHAVGDIHKHYTLGDEIKKGTFGKVVSATRNDTKAERAVKVFKKMYIDSKLGKDSVMTEFNLLKSLDHPNIVKVYESFEDANYIYIVTELMSGGEVFDMLISEGQFEEHKTAEIIRQTLIALAYCHSIKLAHRDLKPQNLLIDNKDGKIFIKLNNFGFSKFFTLDTYFKEAIGTPFFMAPEILKKLPYTYKADIWSLGIMTLMMLTGKLPFPTNNSKKFYESVRNANITKQSFSNFKCLSNVSIDFMLRCLSSNPEERWEAKQLLEHEFIVSSNRPAIPQESIKEIHSNLKEFNGRYKLEQAVYTYLAMNVATSDDEKNLRDLFVAMDKDKNGNLSKSEFITGMQATSRSVYTTRELEEIFTEIDSDHSGMINYTEFLKAAINKQSLLTDQNLKAAFKFFDVDKNGVITADELLNVFTKGNVNIAESLCDAMIKEIDTNKDKNISFEEFKKMMINGLKNAKPI